MHESSVGNWCHRLVNRFRRPTGEPLFLSLSSENLSASGNGVRLRNCDSWRFMDAIVPPLIVVFVFLLSFYFPDRTLQGGQPALNLLGFPAVRASLAPFLPRFAQHPQPQPLQSNSILLISPNGQEQLIAKTALERCGYRLLLADDGEQGVALFGRMPEPIPVVLLDWTVPGAATMLQRLRSIRPDVKVIVSSGDAAPRHFTGKSLEGFLHAPYTPDELRMTLETVLRKAHKS